MADTPRVVVVGAGIGGLVAALLLASRGLQVSVLERADAPGGKMRQLRVDGAAIDAGPTVLTLRWIFEQIFADAGARLDEHLALTPLAVLARHAWGGDAQRDRLDLHADARRTEEAIGSFAGAGEARRFAAFCAEARAVYRTLEAPYMRSQRPTLPGMIGALGLRGLAQLTALGPFATLDGLLARRFRDPRLRQLFGRYATYCGASPWQAPATLMLVAQVELDGVWSVDGGMHRVATAIEALARAKGVRFHYGCEVREIEMRNGRACGVRFACQRRPGASDAPGGPAGDNDRLAADAVVFNGDAAALAQGLLGPGATGAAPDTPRARRSLSALTWAVHGRTAGFPLARHNVFFHAPDADRRTSEFDDIFRRRRLPRQGAVYVCAQDRGDGAPTEDGRRERLLMLVNAPADGDRGGPSPTEIEACEQTHLALLSRCGLRIGRARRVFTGPAEFARLFPATGGALYGPATHGWMALFRRGSAATPIPGLFLCGGSVHPGPGVPMAAMSGRLAAEALMASLASTSRSRAAATSGGTSTPSATTAATR
jgi:1-hydroxycarotenoid 3,4-desaturase